MKTDNTQPWEESTPKTPRLGEVIISIIEINQKNDDQQDSDTTVVTGAETDLDARLDEMSVTLAGTIADHTRLPRPVHQETKATIGLADKENIDRANLEEVRNKTYAHQYATPKLLNVVLTQRLTPSFTDYLAGGLFPISYGRKMGRIVTDTLFNLHAPATRRQMVGTWPTGPVSYMFSAEEDFVMFAEFGTGRQNSTHRTTMTPYGTTRINVDNDVFVIQKGEPATTTSLTFSPAESSTSDATQTVEAALFNASVCYTPNGSLTARNLNTNKHNFHQLTLSNLNGLPTQSASFLSRESTLLWFANARLVRSDSVWCVFFDVVCGDVGIADWYSNDPVKVLSKRSTFTPGTLSSDGVRGYVDSSGEASVVNNGQSLTVRLPLRFAIGNFDTLSAETQEAVVRRLDTGLLSRISLAWTGTDTQTVGIARLPLYYISDTQGYRYWFDMGFTVANRGNNQYDIYFTSAHYSQEYLASVDNSFAMTVPSTSRWRTYPLDMTQSTPLHPRVFNGCFSETGGHITAYNAGHRQYLCFCKHNCGSVQDWIKQDIEPVLNTSLNQITSVGMMSSSHFYSDNLRLVPVLHSENSITYLTRARHPQGAYHYGTFTVNTTTWDFLAATRTSDASEIRWVDTGKTYLTDIPILVEHDNLSGGNISSNGLVFSEANGFTGYEKHGFSGVNFVPSGVCVIDPILQKAILRYAGIKNPYPIFFWSGEMLFWSIISRTGEKNAEGYDACVGSVRVDKQYAQSSDISTLRILPGESMKGLWATVFEETVDMRQMIGLDNPSFDDVYHVNRDGGNTSIVLVNLPDLPGRYISFTTEKDSRGYRYPATFSPDKINLKKECGYGDTCPYLFFASNFCPVLTHNTLYVQTDNIFAYKQYNSQNNGTVVNDYWCSEQPTKQPIYGPGEILTVNGVSHRLNAPVSLPMNDTGYLGKVFFSYAGGNLTVYTANHNPLGLTTEPDNSTMFAGYWSDKNNTRVFSYHALDTTPTFSSQPYTNGLLPTIDGKQMSWKAQGTTFPFILGTTDGSPNQGYFTK